MSTFPQTIPAIGLTGGIASGKSYVSDQLAALGAHVIDTDVLAREVLALGSEGLSEAVQHFGTGILQANGSLNRQALREIIFSDADAKKQLEAITHPRIRTLVQLRLQEANLSGAPYALIVVPLMAEGGRYPFLREVLVVDAGVQSQLQRLITRDGITPELAQQMIQAQATRAVRLKLADHVLSNDAEKSMLAQPIQWLHDHFCKQSRL